MIREIPNCESCLVQKLTCFSFMKPDELADLKYEKSCSLYRRGQIIFQEDNRAMGIYCLNEGKVKLYKISVEGREQIVRFVIPGELFGMRSVIGAKYYSINSQAIEDSIACFFSMETFFNLISRHPQLSKCLLLLLSNQLNDAEDKMTSMAHKPVRERLAEAILSIAEKFSSDDMSEKNSINLSREDLAKMIGSATETVIRLLSEFKEENLIRIDGRKIIILNIRDLKKVANIPITADLTLSFYKEPSELAKNGSLSAG